MRPEERDMSRKAYEESIGGPDRAAVRRVLEQIMNAHERAGANYDELLSLGVRTGGSQHEDADVAVLDWLHASPGNTRVDIASALLTGMWMRRRWKNPFPAANVERLMAARRGLALDGDAEYSYVLALSEAVRHLPEPLRGRALDDMGSAQQRVSPEAQRLIEQLLQRLQ
jgi:hypothetical protein